MTVPVNDAHALLDPRSALIAARNQLRDVIVKLRPGFSATMDTADEALAALDIAIGRFEIHAVRAAAGGSPHAPQPPDEEDRDFGKEYPRLKGRCPSCGAETLFRGSKGYVTCSVIGCKDPCAAHDLLSAAAHQAIPAPPPASRPGEVFTVNEHNIAKILIDRFASGDPGSGLALTCHESHALMVVLAKSIATPPASQGELRDVCVCEHERWQHGETVAGHYAMSCRECACNGFGLPVSPVSSPAKEE